jgi:ATP-binding cassette subfamily B (MDR/TAP) protein 1
VKSTTVVSDSDVVKEADEKEKLQKSGNQDEKKEEEEKDDGVQYERKVGMKGNKLSGGQK